jgi:hypothetical protein
MVVPSVVVFDFDAIGGEVVLKKMAVQISDECCEML